ncbi:hypothetical protein [Mycobacterium uberis]|uniref:hypothetical protein n=1 Tax=Mycobacterium uberis TaxID=2162698 RepID=UPI0026D07825
MMTTLDGFPVLVCIAGPKNGVVVMILGAEQRGLTAYEMVRALYPASLRTFIIGPDPQLIVKSVVGIRNTLGIS